MTRGLADTTVFIARESGRPLDIDDRVSEAWARLRVMLRNRNERMPVNDSWIAATAMSLGVPVVTQDDDYVQVDGLMVIRV